VVRQLKNISFLLFSLVLYGGVLFADLMEQNNIPWWVHPLLLVMILFFCLSIYSTHDRLKAWKALAKTYGLSWKEKLSLFNPAIHLAGAIDDVNILLELSDPAAQEEQAYSDACVIVAELSFPGEKVCQELYFWAELRAELERLYGIKEPMSTKRASCRLFWGKESLRITIEEDLPDPCGVANVLDLVGRLGHELEELAR
jgi:hypothetical protein